jgi:hypothetical protein
MADLAPYIAAKFAAVNTERVTEMLNRRETAKMARRAIRQNEALRKLARNVLPYLVIPALAFALFAFATIRDERGRHEFEAQKMVARHAADTTTPHTSWKPEYVSDQQLKAQHEATAELLRHDAAIAEGHETPAPDHEGPNTTGP